MKKTILIAPFDGPLASALAQEAEAAGWSVALALASQPAPARAVGPEEAPSEAEDAEPKAAQKPGPGALGEDSRESGRASVSLHYTAGSYVSISALILSARNALGELDAAVLISDPAALRADFLAGKPGELAGLVDERCCGPLFLSRELVRRFEARKSGRILLLAPESPRDAALGAAAWLADGAFDGLGRGLFAASASSSWAAYGLRDASGQPSRAARYALELLSEPKSAKAGKWLRYTGKSGLFG